MAHAKLVRTFIMASVLTLLIIGAVNTIIDPYGYFGTPRFRGISWLKPTALFHDRLTHAGALRATDIDCLLLGSSRLTEGMPRHHAAFEGCERVYNAGLAGPTMHEVRRLFEEVASASKLRRVWLGVDLFTFNATREPARGFSEQLFSTNRGARITHGMSVALSLDTLIDSARTLVGQQGPTFFLQDGFADPEYLSLPLRVRSTRSTFLRGVRGYIPHELPPPRSEFAFRTSESDPIDDLEALLTAAHRRGIDVVVFVNPAHAWQWELISGLGLWSSWEQWKRALVAANDRAAAAAGTNPYPLWDFSGYHVFATEQVPADETSMRPMRWFWDPSHFNHSLGARVLDQIDGNGGEPVGVRLTNANVEAHLRSLRAIAEVWRYDNLEDVVAVNNVVRCFAPSRVRIRLDLRSIEPATCQRLTELTR